MTRESILKHALTLPPDERARLVDDLLNSMLDEANVDELTPEQRQELLRRLQADRDDPAGTVRWEELKTRILREN